MDASPAYRFCPYDATPLRGTPPACDQCDFTDYGNPKPGVAILIVDGRRVLLARRAFEPAKGAWDLPGGFVEAGESGEEAAVREAREEMALEIRVTEYLGSAPDVYGPRNVPTLTSCYLAEIVSGEVRAGDDVAGLAWVDLDAPPGRMAFRHQAMVLGWVRDRQAKGPG